MMRTPRGAAAGVRRLICRAASFSSASSGSSSSAGGPPPRRPLTPLAQAALDAREELAARVANAEANEHIAAPGVDLDSAIDIMSDRAIRQAQAAGDFAHVRRPGKRLDERRLVGDIEGNAGVVAPWVQQQHEIERRTEALRSASAVSESDAGLLELNEAIRAFNRICPPPFQRPLVTPASLAKRAE